MCVFCLNREKLKYVIDSEMLVCQCVSVKYTLKYLAVAESDLLQAERVNSDDHDTHIHSVMIVCAANV